MCFNLGFYKQPFFTVSKTSHFYSMVILVFILEDTNGVLIKAGEMRTQEESGVQIVHSVDKLTIVLWYLRSWKEALPANPNLQFLFCFDAASSFWSSRSFLKLLFLFFFFFSSIPFSSILSPFSFSFSSISIPFLHLLLSYFSCLNPCPYSSLLIYLFLSWLILFFAGGHFWVFSYF